ncbi:MAG: hypothetical protein A2Y63_04260 [Candidatus Riflebacteria bacterium RBG_13_59_9]|nr:MAG: hypothetical protein A2Y63_04260 [Candidatus Riflebacteria bacterium RBG_13_59_9]
MSQRASEAVDGAGPVGARVFAWNALHPILGEQLLREASGHARWPHRAPRPGSESVPWLRFETGARFATGSGCSAWPKQMGQPERFPAGKQEFTDVSATNSVDARCCARPGLVLFAPAAKAGDVVDQLKQRGMVQRVKAAIQPVQVRPRHHSKDKGRVMIPDSGTGRPIRGKLG